MIAIGDTEQMTGEYGGVVADRGHIPVRWMLP